MGKIRILSRPEPNTLPDFPLPDLSGLHVLRAGVEAGQCVKGRFEPAHGLFMAFLDRGGERTHRPAGPGVRYL